MISEEVLEHIDAYKSHNQVIDGVKYLLRTFNIDSENLETLRFRDDDNPKLIVITTEGDFGVPQIINLPKNILDIPLSLTLNLLAHEMLHVKQKAITPFVSDKNEREWQAYFEMLFHKNYPQIPDAPDFNRKNFAEQANEYYKRMGEGSELQLKYADEKKLLDSLYDEILIKRGEKIIEKSQIEEESIKPEISWSDFEKIDMRTGTIISAQDFEKAKNPSYQLEIDFGPLGIKKSAAQITALYTKEELIGKNIIAVVNFPKKQIANFFSECLILGIYGENNLEVNLLTSSLPTKNGLKIG